MTDPSPNRVYMGKIATAHGIRGLVKLDINGDDPHLLASAPLYTSEDGPATLKITLKNPLGKQWLAAVDGITDRTQAEALRGTPLWLDRALLPELKHDNEFYITDLLGLTVVTPSGTPLGRIIAVDNFGAGDLLEIQPMGGASYYLPFTDETVPTLDIENGLLTAIIPEGLI